MFKEIKNFEGYIVYDDGQIYGPRCPLKPFMGRGGYLKVCLSKNNKRKWIYVHRLVCELFIPNILNKKEVNHIDGNKLNNKKENLEWVTRSENNLHAFRIGLKKAKKGESNYWHKLTHKDVLEIRKLRGIYTQRKLEKMYGVTHSHISKIQRNKNWEVANV